MATYTFTLRPGVTLSDAKVQYGGGNYDIDDGLTAGSGTITTTDDGLAAALRTAMTTVAGATVTLLIEGGVTPGAAPPDLRANVPVFVQGAQPTQRPYWWVKTDGSGNPTGAIEFHDGASAHAVTSTGGPSQITTVAASGAAYQFPTPTHDAIIDVTLTANCTLSMPATPPTAGTSFTAILRQDATGARAITWPAGLKWSNGYAPPVTPTASTADLFVFTYLGASLGWMALPAAYDVR